MSLRCFVPSSLRSAVVVSLFRFVTRLVVSSLRCFVSSFCSACFTAPQPVAKILRHSEEKRPFLLQIAAGHRSVRHNSDLPSSLPFQDVPPSLERGLLLLAALIRGGGRSQAQDHGHAIKPKYGTVSQNLLQLVVAWEQDKVYFTHELHEVVDSLGNMANFSRAEELKTYLPQSVQFISNRVKNRECTIRRRHKDFSFMSKGIAV